MIVLHYTIKEKEKGSVSVERKTEDIDSTDNEKVSALKIIDTFHKSLEKELKKKSKKKE